VDAIVRTMVAFPDNGAVQAQGCGALRNLACGIKEDPQSRSRVIENLLEAGGLPAIVAAMRTHMSTPSVISQACAALRNLAAGPESPTAALMEAGAILTCVVIVGDGYADAEATLQGCAFVSNVMVVQKMKPTSISDARWREIEAERRDACAAAVDAGVVEGAMEALRRWVGLQSVCREVCVCLHTLTERMAEAGAACGVRAQLVAVTLLPRVMRTRAGLSALADAILQHRGDAALTFHAASVLCFLAPSMQHEPIPISNAALVKSVLLSKELYSNKMHASMHQHPGWAELMHFLDGP